MAAGIAGLTIGAGMALFAGASLAADESDTTSSGELGDIVVTATRREQNINDVPFSTTALAGDPLVTLGDAGDDIKQLAFKVPSLNIESSNGRAFPRLYIRGYGNTDFHDFASQPVGLVYDDIVQENAALKGFPIFDQADVEVLRGPQGTLFGRNSPAGVLKLESAKPKLDDTSGSVSLSDGTYNSSVIEGYANVPLNSAAAIRLSFQSQHRDDWVSDPINDTSLGGYTDSAVRAQLLFSPSDTFTALFNVHGRDLNGSSTLFRANVIQPGTNSLISSFTPAAYYADGPNSASLQTYGANVHLTWKLDGLTLQSITGYETVSNYLSVGDIDGGYGPGNVFCQPTCTGPASGPGLIPFPVQTSAGIKNHQQATQEFRVVSDSTGPLKAQAGIFLFYENVTADDDDYCAPGNCITTGPLYQPFALQDITQTKQTNDAEAIFGSVDYTPVEAFTATAGVRYTEDHRSMSAFFVQVTPSYFSNAPIDPLYAGRSASNVSWDVSATYKFTPDFSVYARVATGFRAPTLGEPGAGTSIQVVRAETNISYESGLHANFWDHRARVAFDGFYYDVSNQQLSAVGGDTTTTLLLNAAHTVGYGSELELEAEPIPNLTFNLTGSLNITRIEDPSLSTAVCFSCTVLNPLNKNGDALINGNPLPQAAKWVADASVRYDIPLTDTGKAYVYSDLSWRSGVNFFLYESKEFDGPPLTLLGVRLGYEWGAGGKYDAALFCRNCANQVREIGAIDFDNLTAYVNDPRIVGVKFRGAPRSGVRRWGSTSASISTCR
jgi:iron complex outermembrane receptor protein